MTASPPAPQPAPQPAAEAFIARWSSAGGGERSNYQLFLTELCDLIGAPKPDPAVEAKRRGTSSPASSQPHLTLSPPKKKQ